MAPTTDSDRIDPRATILAGAVPFLFYVLSASGYAHWFDSGEFVAVAADLGISHPPGHPLTALVASLANLLPLGPLAFRVALINAALVSIATMALFRAAVLTLRQAGLTRCELYLPLAMAAAWWTAGCYAWWFQAVRPEVYALQGALLCLAVERLLTQEARWPTQDLAPLYQAALFMGLALANHHFLAILLFPAALPLTVRIIRSQGMQPIARATLFLFAGLATYLYLPMRGLADPYLNLGEPTSPQRFFWTISAQAFQKSLETEYQPLWERFGDVGIALSTGLGVLVVIAGALGLYFMARVPGTRRFAWVWLSIVVVYVAGRALLGFVRSNPDALGYLMLGFGAVSVGAVTAVGIGIVTVEQSLGRPTRFARPLAITLAVLALMQFPITWSDASLAYFKDTEHFDESLRRDLPDHAVIFAHNPQTIFRFWGGEAEERDRPDLTLIPLPFLTYPGMIERYIEAEPELKPALRSYLLAGHLRAPELQTLAIERPVFVEMDVRVPLFLYRTLVPHGLFHRVVADGATYGDEQQGAQRHAAVWQRLYEGIGDPRDHETRSQLIWRHYVDALYFAGFGDRTSARRMVDAGLKLNPDAKELNELLQALNSPETGPLDVRPYLPR